MSIDWEPGVDFEIYDSGWQMFWHDKLLASGTYRTVAGLYARLWWECIKFKLGFGEPARMVRAMR